MIHSKFPVSRGYAARPCLGVGVGVKRGTEEKEEGRWKCRNNEKTKI